MIEGGDVQEDGDSGCGGGAIMDVFFWGGSWTRSRVWLAVRSAFELDRQKNPPDGTVPTTASDMRPASKTKIAAVWNTRSRTSIPVKSLRGVWSVVGTAISGQGGRVV
jgi:hypothetical protein